MPAIDEDIHIVCLVKEQTKERYVWLYRVDQTREVLRSFGRFASNPRLSFTWLDAATLSQKIRRIKNGLDGG